MKSDTPRTDEWETYCDECYYHMWRVRRKNERGFNDGFHVQNGEGARQLVELLNKQDDELIAARAEIERLDTAGIHSCHNDCQRPNCVLRRELKAVTEHRDRLAKALKKLRNNESMSLGGAAYEIVEQALQSLTTNAEVSFCSASSEIP